MGFAYRYQFLRTREENLSAYSRLHLKEAKTTLGPGISLGEDKLTTLVGGAVFEVTDRFNGVNRVDGSLVLGLGGMLGAMDEDGDGASSRFGRSGDRAGGDYTKIVVDYARLQRIFDYQDLFVRIYTQQSSDLLVAIEQMSLGGPGSVRGYAPAEVLVDSGTLFTFEWVGHSANPNPGEWYQDLRLSGFLDHAVGERNDPFGNEEADVSMTSIGAGASARPLGLFDAKLEVAFPIGSREPLDGDSFRYFFTLEYQF
jgi:hemolysin activation/secretion protein